MKLGFVSAILPDLSLEEILAFAAAEGFACVEMMCWPVGEAERRYAGVTHIEVADFSETEVERVRDLCAKHNVELSALGYYPNLLATDEKEATFYGEHLKKVILAAASLGVPTVNTFIGRDPMASPEANWTRFIETWPDLIHFAETHKICIGIENCPMYFTRDEWPAGKNLAISPAIWRQMFATIPSPYFGLNYDPSHLVWQQMDTIKPLREFGERIFHIHAKDARVDRERLDDVGILATPLEFHVPKLPGLGDIDWGQFFSALGDTGYDGAVCIEIEDRAYEQSLESRKAALRQSARFLRNFMG
jgi:sugar phosphate isomerase/epimerase